MDDSSTTPIDAAIDAPDRLSVRRWLVVFAAYLAVLAAPAAVLLGRLGVPWRQLFIDPGAFTAPADQVLKLLIFAVYISLCTTFLPLPTGWLVAALATRTIALHPSLLVTTVLVATVGAAASTMANLLDFHLFTWILRLRRVASVRRTRLVTRAAAWFARRPFAILVIFNVIPIPVDVIRMLAATARYGLRPFAVANFIGRWIRYAILAAVAGIVPKGYDWIPVVALLAAAVVLGAGRGLGDLLRRRRASPAGDERE